MKAPPCDFDRNLDKAKFLSMEIRTPISTREMKERLTRFFGKGGLGLPVTGEGPDCLRFEGGGGHVQATFCAEGEKTLLRIVTSEWAAAVKEFVCTLP